VLGCLGAWVLGCLGVGCWVLGARQGRPGVRRLKGVGSLSRRLFRAALAGTPPPDLAAAYPLNTARGPDGVPTPSVQEDTAKRKKKFWALGVRYWALGVYGFGRWVSTTELGCWVARATCWVLGVGRWMPLAKALGGVGGPREATARWEHK